MYMFNQYIFSFFDNKAFSFKEQFHRIQYEHNQMLLQYMKFEQHFDQTIASQTHLMFFLNQFYWFESVDYCDCQNKKKVKWENYLSAFVYDTIQMSAADFIIKNCHEINNKLNLQICEITWIFV